MNKIPTFRRVVGKGKIKILDAEFELDCSGGNATYMKTKSKEMREMSEALIAGTKGEADAAKLTAEYIEHMLGEGALEKIFGSDKPDFETMVDIVLFINQTVQNFAAKRAAMIAEMAKG